MENREIWMRGFRLVVGAPVRYRKSQPIPSKILPRVFLNRTYHVANIDTARVSGRPVKYAKVPDDAPIARRRLKLFEFVKDIAVISLEFVRQFRCCAVTRHISHVRQPMR